MSVSENKQERHLAVIPHERIENKIYLIRGKKVMIDRDLAQLYDVETRALNQAVRRNIRRFPEDFMFQLTKEESENWKSQIVISNREKMGFRKPPLAFTEHGILMLSSVLKSEKAIFVNIQIMRAFVKLRELMITHRDLGRRLDELEKKFKNQDEDILMIFQIIREMIQKPKKPVEPEIPKSGIGFHAG